MVQTHAKLFAHRRLGTRQAAKQTTPSNHHLPRIPSLPNLISQFLISQQGFNVDFGEHETTFAHKRANEAGPKTVQFT